MKVKDWIKQVAYIGKSDIPEDDGNCWYSKFDKSYITRVGMEDQIKFLVDRGITEQLTHGVGFSPSEGKWYGWSHRAIFGFQIGSTVKKGDCAYRAPDIEAELEAAVKFWDEDDHINTTAKLTDEGIIEVTWEYSDNIPNKKLRNTISGTEWRYDPNNFGKGEWTAESMEDAKQMAMDFNKGVS